MTGIYGIQNLITNKWYVGQAVDIELRWKKHIWALRNQYHYNRHLLRSWQKYGEDNFQFIVLEECKPADLNEKEVFWISQLKTFTNGYNECKGGNGTSGCKWSKEARTAFANARRGEHNPFYGKHHSDSWKISLSNRQVGDKNKMFGRTGENHPKSRPVQCIETGVIYSGLREAERQTGVNRNNISSCCTGRLKSAGKFHWKYII